MNTERTERELENQAFFEAFKRLGKGDKAALKRSLGTPRAEAGAAAWAALYRLLPGGRPRAEEAYFLIACGVCLFERLNAPPRPLVACLRELSAESDGAERRLVQLMDIPLEDDGYFSVKLSRILRMLYQKGMNVDFAGLLEDLLDWNRNGRRVQLRWARDFFGARAKDEGGRNDDN